MRQILNEIRALVATQNILVSDHGFDELASDNIFVQDVIEGVMSAILVEDYPDYHKGPCVLVLQLDKDGTHSCCLGDSERCVLPSGRGDRLSA